MGLVAYIVILLVVAVIAFAAGAFTEKKTHLLDKTSNALSKINPKNWFN